jgi:hypothetical protein
MGRKDDLWENEFWTQGEVARYFRVVPGTVKNWREQGLLSFWQVPGSTKVLYFRDELREFQGKNTISKKGGDKPTGLNRIQRERPVVSSIEEDWRI